jgi:hypothetical protein
MKLAYLISNNCLTAQRLVQYDVLPVQWCVFAANELSITRDTYLK